MRRLMGQHAVIGGLWPGRLGPGLVFAATAVGVSHLVQSTRAGAEFGLTLLVLILAACAIKYPAFRFGAEYAALTGRTVLSGYERQGRWLLALILLATFIEGVGVVPAVTLVTVGLGMNLLGMQVDAIIATVTTVLVASIVLLVGRYRVLENITRVFVALFAILTVVATLAAIAGIARGNPSRCLSSSTRRTCSSPYPWPAGCPSAWVARSFSPRGSSHVAEPPVSP